MRSAAESPQSSGRSGIRITIKKHLAEDYLRDDGPACRFGVQCPLSSVHSRLQEAHRHWHHADASYADYLALMAALQADMERRGTQVVRLRVPVSRVIEELERHNWPNDNKHRAKVIGELGATTAASS